MASKKLTVEKASKTYMKKKLYWNSQWHMLGKAVAASHPSFTAICSEPESRVSILVFRCPSLTNRTK